MNADEFFNTLNNDRLAEGHVVIKRFSGANIDLWIRYEITMVLKNKVWATMSHSWHEANLSARHLFIAGFVPEKLEGVSFHSKQWRKAQ